MNKHRQRVQRLRKLKGKYICIPVRSKRHANQIKLAIRDAGISFDEFWTNYKRFMRFWIVYTFGNAGLYDHRGASNPLLVNL